MSLFFKIFMTCLAAVITIPAFADSPFIGQKFFYFGKLPQNYSSQASVTLEVSFYETSQGNDVLSRVPRIYKNLPLQNGEFKIAIEMDQLEFNVVFPNPVRPAYIQIKDVTKNVVFRRLPFSPDLKGSVTSEAAENPGQEAPGAATEFPVSRTEGSPASVPEARSSSDFSSIARSACVAANTAGAKFIVNIQNPAATCQSACVHTEARSTCIRGWTVFSESKYFEFGDECTKGATGFESPVLSRVCCCVTTSRPMPVQLESAHH